MSSSIRPDPAVPSVGFISLGCAKNLVDSQNMAGVLLSEQIRLAPSPEEADIILVNTCAFIEDARRESIETIRSACRLKTEGRCKAVLVTGCFPQRYGDKLQRSLPGVDAFLGLDQLEQVGDVVRRLAEGEHGIVRVSREAHEVFEPRVPGISFSGGPHAYLRVADGCNHPCTFCAIPAIRGRHRSRPPAGILAEAEQLLRNGICELDLISQDVTGYGRDLPAPLPLDRLIRRLGKLGSGFWIRILYGYPTQVTDDLLETMAGTPHVCHYLDVPIQHSHPEILRSMSRGGTIEPVQTLPDRARALMPDVTLRTTCLVGFPGETDKHFEHLLEHVRRTRYDHLGVFTYSPEEGTPAASLPGRVESELAAERRDALMLEQQQIVREKAETLVGTQTTVLLEGPAEENGLRVGRSPRYAPRVDGQVYIKGVPEETPPGTFIEARYTEPLDYDMGAEFLERLKS